MTEAFLLHYSVSRFCWCSFCKDLLLPVLAPHCLVTALSWPPSSSASLLPSASGSSRVLASALYKWAGRRGCQRGLPGDQGDSGLCTATNPASGARVIFEGGQEDHPGASGWERSCCSLVAFLLGGLALKQNKSLLG